jgi:hypothetical protein
VNLRLLMVGLPESGKTTFLAALYELVGAQPPLPEALSLRTQPQDREYFFEINQTWLKLEQLGHSNVNAPRHAQMPLVDPQGAELDLDIPDVVGESFLSGWEGNGWPAQLADIARGVEGLLLFAHGTALQPPVKLTPGELEEPAPGAPQTNGGAAPWNAAKAPTQTILADLLEALIDINERPLPTAVVVSAWDSVKDEITPATWLQLNLPLLWQMLEGRDGTPPFEVFGVSAQGGDVTDPQERERLARVTPPRDRILIQLGDVPSHDITAPVSWLLDRVR